MTSTSGSTCHCKRRLATTVCAGVLALAASAILLASNDGLSSSGHRQLKATMAASSSERKIHHKSSGRQDTSATAAAAGKNKRRQLAKDDEYRMIGERKLSTTSAQGRRTCHVAVWAAPLCSRKLHGALVRGGRRLHRSRRAAAVTTARSIQPQSRPRTRAPNTRPGSTRLCDFEC